MGPSPLFWGRSETSMFQHMYLWGFPQILLQPPKPKLATLPLDLRNYLPLPGMFLSSFPASQLLSNLGLPSPSSWSPGSPPAHQWGQDNAGLHLASYLTRPSRLPGSVSFPPTETWPIPSQPEISL